MSSTGLEIVKLFSTNFLSEVRVSFADSPEILVWQQSTRRQLQLCQADSVMEHNCHYHWTNCLWFHDTHSLLNTAKQTHWQMDRHVKQKPGGPRKN